MYFASPPSSFEKLGRITLFSLFLLVFVGSFVRSSGSGLGCPDWPKCFGQYIPPTQISQLPENYQEIYQVAGKKVAPFDAVKTWTEYFNRLLGVTVGFLVLLQFFYSLKENKRIIQISLLSLITIAFQGWMGKVVVSSDLHPFIITIHMLLALLIIFQVIMGLRYSESLRNPLKEKVKDWKTSHNWWMRYLGITLFLLILQLFLGIQVRESVDHMMALGEGLERTDWANGLSSFFIFHRFLGPMIFWWHLLAWMFFQKKHPLPNFQKTLVIGMVLCIFEIIIGIILVKFSFPKLVIPMHLLSAFLIIAFYFDQITKRYLHLPS